MLQQKKCDIAIGAFGFGAIITQTIFLRECLSLFYGNELVIGIVLANWMILTGIGAYGGRFAVITHYRHHAILLILLLLSILPLTTIFVFNYGRNILFSPGTMIGVTSSFIVSFLLLLPYCILSGYAFTLCAQTLSEHYARNTIARAYALEAVGSVVGGILLNLILLVYCTTSQALLIIALILLGTVFILSPGSSYRTIRYSSLLLGVVCVGVLLNVDLDTIMKSYLYEGQRVIVHRDTPYGTITVTSQDNQKNIFENGILLWSMNDVTADEEAVHYAMVQHPRPRKVLLISGGISGIPAEILKYNVDRIDYVELNPWLIEIGRQLIPKVLDRRFNVLTFDARRFVRETQERYDVVLVNVSDPSTAQINRYYTLEFFRDLKKRLAPGAVISLSMHSSADYFSPAAIAVYSTIVRTLKDQFAHILIVPGSKNFFLASDDSLSIDITELIARRGIQTEYVNRDYVDDVSARQRSDEILNRLDPHASLNLDFTPVAYYHQLLYWLSYSNLTLWIPICIILILIGLILRKLNAVSFGMLTTGLAASGIEVLLLFSFQILYGIMYQATGCIITVFMGGLAMGSWYAQKYFERPSVVQFGRVQLIIAVYAIMLPGILMLLREIQFGTFTIYCIFILLTLVISVLIGLEFSIAVRLYRGTISHVTSTLYGVDLLGSAIGAIGVSVFLVPVAGMAVAFFVIALLSIVSAVISFTGQKIHV